MAGNATVVTDDNFETEVLNSTLPVLIDFWAPWCGPCHMVSPIVEELGKDYQGRLKIGKLNVDDNNITAQNYGIMSIPTLLLFKNGRLVQRMVGAMPKSEFKKRLDKVL